MGHDRHCHTNVMCLVKYYDGIFRHLLRNLFSNFGVKKVVEGVDDDVYKWHLTKG